MKREKKENSVGVAELKAKLASYLRRVKSGDEIEVLERGIPVATLRPMRVKRSLEIIPPGKDPTLFGKYRFSVRPQKSFDAVEYLLEERRKG